MWLTYLFLPSEVNRDNSCYPRGSAFRRKRAMVLPSMLLLWFWQTLSGLALGPSPPHQQCLAYERTMGWTNKPHPWDSSLHEGNRFRKNKLHTRTSIIFCFICIFFLFAPFLILKPLWWTVAQAFNPSRGSLVQNLASWHPPGAPHRYQHNSHCILSPFHLRMDVLHLNCVWTQVLQIQQ